MTKADRKKQVADKVLEKLRHVIRHIKNVQDNCILLAEKLIAAGECDLGRRLVAHAFLHDNSKFAGLEWETLTPGKPTDAESAKIKLRLAVANHSAINPHHPEYWTSIQDMPKLYKCEMVADWKARSEEFGTDLRVWINESASKRFGFSEGDKTHKEIMELVDLLCEKPFSEPAS